MPEERNPVEIRKGFHPSNSEQTFRRNFPEGGAAACLVSYKYFWD